MAEKRLHLLEGGHDTEEKDSDASGSWPAGSRDTIVGRITAVTADGAIWVDFEDHPGQPLRAVTTAGISIQDVGREVLILFERGDRRRPIVVGCLSDKASQAPAKGIALELDRRSPDEIRVDGRQVVIEASHELLLKCGEGSILVKHDGSIVIKGTRIVSRAKGIQKIKGAAVSIN